MKKGVLVLLLLMVCCAKENVPKGGAIRVNGSWIKSESIDRVAEMYRQEMMRSAPEKALEGTSPKMKQDIAKQLIANEVVLLEAKKKKIGFSEEKYQSTLASIKRQFQDSATLVRELAKMGQTEADMKNQIKDGLAVDSLIKTLLKKQDTASFAECKAFYDNNASKFVGEKKFRVSQILFKVSQTATAEQKKAASQKASGIVADAKAGKDFAALAKKYSEDGTTAGAGGDIGWFKRGDLMREFDAVATPLALNQISDVFETPAGFHIIKKTGEETLPTQSFDQVKDQIKKMLDMKKQNDVVKTYVDSLIKVATIFYADTTLKMSLEMPGSMPK